MQYDVIIIGGGCSGLTAAITLAKLGRRVAVVEKDKRLAPLLRGFSRQGVHFDTGVHYVGGLGSGGVLESYFRFLGIDDVERKELRPACANIFKFLDSSREITFPHGADSFVSMLMEEFPDEADGIVSFWERVEKTAAQSPFLNLQHSLDEDALIPDLDVPSVADEARRATSNPYLQAAFSLHALLYGVSPEQARFDAHAYTLASYVHSAHSFPGGGKVLADALEKRARELDCDVFCGKGVERILVDDGCFAGVQFANGKTIHSRQCIYTGHPALLPDLLPEGAVRPQWAKRLKRLEDTAQAMVLFAIADHPVELLTDSNVFLCTAPCVEKFFEADEGVIYLAGGEPLPDGRQAITVVTAASTEGFSEWQETSYGNRPYAYHKEKERISKAIWQRVQDGCPELRDGVSLVDVATPLTMQHWVASPTGSLYGVRHCIDQISPMPMTKVKGLGLAGQSVLLPGVLGAMVSAFVTCGCLVGMKELHKELRACIREE
ncbi:NAD(P)/FAD-dependent oxidoreductase [Halodesulfovibrio sp.]|uniref:phytoene desaturase family protein n=1 Tax=Halodesulfovibrio sp. TaxID=1912772 RepID=UPI0025C6FE13|nr:NAD(P)/FAD-dependent oxidoreductase [Halodesulfovibrio sp.]